MNTDSLMLLISLVFYMAAAAFYIAFISFERLVLGRWAVAAVLAGFICHSILLVRQAVFLIQTATITLFEVLVFFLWALAGLAALLQFRMRLRSLLGILLSLVVAAGCAALAVPETLSRTVPSLNAFWFASHILVSLMGYAAFLIALVSGILYLVLDRQLKRKKGDCAFGRLPPLENLEWVGLRAVWSGAILLGLGLASGLVWVKWAVADLPITDPKVIGSWITLAIYSSILYVRSTARWRGRKVAYLNIIGFASVIVTFFVMNYFSKGHGFF